jgi:uncharacterized damage-inducible protein DinB
LAPITPYSAQLGDREPIAAIRATVDRIQALTANWTAAQFDLSYAAGKWSARQILIHLAQAEVAFGARTRMALARPDYAAENYDQDRWMKYDRGLSGADARDAFVALGRFNAALFASLTPAERQTPFSHPEYGQLTVDWTIHQVAGHQIHHLKQLESVG